MAGRIHGNEGALFQVRLSLPNCAENNFADGRRQHVLGPDLNDTWSGPSLGREEHPEILIVRKYGSVAESMGRIVGETPLPVEEAESGTVPRGMPAPASG